MENYNINIVHLYPDLLNLYGDKGNIECLKKRLIWRGIDVEILECCEETPEINFEKTDIIFLGGGSDHEQDIVRNRLLPLKNHFQEYVKGGGTFIALCGGFELICEEILINNIKCEGLGLLDISCNVVSDQKRLIGNVVAESDIIDGFIIGFENHAGRIDIKDYNPLCKIKVGFGNNGKSDKDGVIYKNLFASYLHGPLFPKNPQLCDKIIETTLHHKYDGFNNLKELNDDLEKKANEFMLKRILK